MRDSLSPRERAGVRGKEAFANVVPSMLLDARVPSAGKIRSVLFLVR